MSHTLAQRGNAYSDRPNRIFVRVSPKEKAMFEKAAKNDYKTLSQFVRDLLHKEIEVQGQNLTVSICDSNRTGAQWIFSRKPLNGDARRTA